MKKMLLPTMLMVLISATVSSYAAIQPATAWGTQPASTQEAALMKSAETSAENFEKLSRQERKALKKQMKSDIREAVKAHRASGADAETLLLVILAILLPPLAMALYDGISTRFWISLILTLLFFIPGVIYTLVVILGDN